MRSSDRPILLSRRLPARTILGLAGAMALFAVAAGAQPAPLRVIHDGDTSRVVVRRLDGAEVVSLAEIAAAVSGDLRNGSDEAIELRVGSERLRFEAGRSFVAVGRRDRLLASPAIRRGDGWFVPFDFVSRVLLDILPRGTRFDERSRTLAVGGGYPRLRVDIRPRPGATRIEVSTDPPARTEIEETERGLEVVIHAPFVETAFLGEAPMDGVVERVDLRHAEETYVLEVTTGRNFGRMLQERGRGRLALDLIRSGLGAESGSGILPPLPGAAPPESRPGDDLAPGAATGPREIRTVAIDPGHGGADLGVVGPDGIVVEKDVALEVALALRRILEDERGFEVVLTRETDREAGLDDRAAMANAARADVLVSLHLNASPSPASSGSLVYHHAPIAVRRATRGETVRFVAWNESQAAAASASAALAGALAATLAELPIPSAGVADAPVRMLAAAAMPAVQIELGFVTSEGDRNALVAPDFAQRAARAVADGIFRFQTGRPPQPPTGGPS